MVLSPERNQISETDGVFSSQANWLEGKRSRTGREGRRHLVRRQAKEDEQGKEVTEKSRVCDAM